MNVNEEIIIFVYVVAKQKWYECIVHSSSNFRHVIQVLKEAEKSDLEYDFEGDVRIYEFVYNIPCDLDISFQSAGVKNGMSFIIY